MIVLRLLLHTVRQHPGAFLTDAVLQLCRTSLLLVPPLLFKRILDSFEQNANINTLTWLLIAGALAASTVRMVIVLLATAYDGLLKARIIESLTRSALRSALLRPGAAPLRHPVGDVVNRLSVDTMRVADQCIMVMTVFSHGVQAVVALALMLSVDAPMTAAVLLPMTVASAAVWLSRSRSARLYGHERQAAGTVSHLISDAIGGAIPIQLSDARVAMMRRLRQACEVRRRQTIQARTFFEVLLSATMSNLTPVGVGLMLVIAAFQLDGGISVGDLALFMAYVAAVMSFVGAAGTHAAAYRLADVSAARLEDAIPGTVENLKENEAPVATGEKEPEPFRSLVVQNLTYLHPGTDKGIREVSLTLTHGELLVVLGHVGAGKTTLLRAMLGLLTPQAGRVLVNDELAQSLRPPRFGYTPQRPALVSGTIKENVLAGLEIDSERVDAAVWTSVLDRDVRRWPEGMETGVGSGGTGLSGGQVQRVATARMHIREPDVYFVDDPSSALDRRTEREMWRRLLGRDGVTCVAVTHRRELIERAEQVLVLRDGEVEALGTWDEVRAVSSTAQHLFPGMGRLRRERRGRRWGR